MPFAQTSRLTSKGAKTMMEAAIAKAEDYGIAVTVAIVDAGGHLLHLERMDGGRFHTIHSSTVKAVCSASNKRPTTTQIPRALPCRVGMTVSAVAVGGTDVRRLIVERPATQHTVFALCRTQRITDNLLTAVGSVPVLAPFPYIAVHII